MEYGISILMEHFYAVKASARPSTLLPPQGAKTTIGVDEVGAQCRLTSALIEALRKKNEFT